MKLNGNTFNTAACHFDALISVLKIHPEHHQAEVHAVNLVSVLAQMPGKRACVALVHAKNFSRYAGFERTVEVLQSYGVTLYRTWHGSKAAFFLFAQLELEPDPASSVALMAPVDEQALERAA